jgi:hypothetical protein
LSAPPLSIVNAPTPTLETDDVRVMEEPVEEGAGGYRAKLAPKRREVVAA